MADQPPAAQDLVDRVQRIGRMIGAREAAHGEALEAARRSAERPSFPPGAHAEVDAALGDFLERFLEEASAP